MNANELVPSYQTLVLLGHFLLFKFLYACAYVCFTSVNDLTCQVYLARTNEARIDKC